MAKLCKEEVTDSQGDMVKGRRRESEEEKLGSSEGMCVVLSSVFVVLSPGFVVLSLGFGVLGRLA